MAENQWEPCPRCNSNKVQVYGKSFFFILGLCLAGITFWLGFFFPPIWFGVILGLIFMIIAPFSQPVLQCKDCNKSWRIKKKKAAR